MPLRVIEGLRSPLSGRFPACQLCIPKSFFAEARVHDEIYNVVTLDGAHR